MVPPQLQWNAAEVNGGVLSVPVEGDRPKGWKGKFQRVVALLGGGPWGEVAYKSGSIRVTEVADGSADSLHHFLEAAMQETNAAFGADQPGAGQEDAGPEELTHDDADARLTEVFRNFGS
jgi:hypothetical protein